MDDGVFFLIIPLILDLQDFVVCASTSIYSSSTFGLISMFAIFDTIGYTSNITVLLCCRRFCFQYDVAVFTVTMNTSAIMMRRENRFGDIIVAAGPWTDTSEKKNSCRIFFLTPPTPPTIVNCIIITSFCTL